MTDCAVNIVTDWIPDFLCFFPISCIFYIKSDWVKGPTYHVQTTHWKCESGAWKCAK